MPISLQILTFIKAILLQSPLDNELCEKWLLSFRLRDKDNLERKV